MAVRTDLVIETREMFAGEISGVESRKQDTDGITVTHVEITTSDGAQKIGRPMGNYVTIEITSLETENEDLCIRGAKAVGDELKKMIKSISPEGSVLIACLGNQYITPDSIGPKTLNKLLVTRHITKDAGGNLDFDVRPVSAIAPGVLGLTGIETKEIILGVAERIKPSVIIAVDALASRSLSRLGTTVQISDTGISPGSGVGNNRSELTEKTLGVPVIAVGIPMVVDAATVVADAVDSVRSHIKGAGDIQIAALFTDAHDLASKVLSENNKNMVVTPNDVDVISEQASTIIAEGINNALF